MQLSEALALSLSYAHPPLCSSHRLPRCLARMQLLSIMSGLSANGQKKLNKANAWHKRVVGLYTPALAAAYAGVRIYAWPAVFDTPPLTQAMKIAIGTSIASTLCSAMWLFSQLGAWRATELKNSPATDLLGLGLACLFVGMLTDWIFVLVAVVPLYLGYKVARYILSWILSESESERIKREAREAEKAEQDERDRKRRAREDRLANRDTMVAGRRRNKY